MFVTVVHGGGGLYEYTQFADTVNATQTDRGEAIVRFQAGQRVLFQRSAPMRDKVSGRTQVEKLFGKVLDANAA